MPLSTDPDGSKLLRGVAIGLVRCKNLLFPISEQQEGLRDARGAKSRSSEHKYVDYVDVNVSIDTKNQLCKAYGSKVIGKNIVVAEFKSFSIYTQQQRLYVDKITKIAAYPSKRVTTCSICSTSLDSRRKLPDIPA